MRPLSSGLYAATRETLRRRAAPAATDLAEEVTQEAYVKIWNNAGQFNPGQSSPITWMASIARNRAIDIVRKRSEASLLAYYNGWSRDQLAEKFATPVNTVKTWLRRSMMDIRECLGL